MSSELLNIFQRINKIREAVHYIKKDAEVQNYKVVTHDAVLSGLRRHLVEYGVIILPVELESKLEPTGTLTKQGVPFMRFEAKYRINFVNADDSKDSFWVELTSHAIDQADKAPGKALSYAVKYAMLKVFSIETGESEESREEQKAPSEKVDLYKTINLGKAIERHQNTINVIKDGIMRRDYSAAAEAWFELDHDEMASIWVAPTKGGPFTTEEREIMKSKEFREAHFGPDVTGGKDD